jgi:transglutaminase-like putative cysteine protease
MTEDALARALLPTRFLDAESEAVRAFAAAHAGAGSSRDRAVRLYYAVRDAVRYDLRYLALSDDTFVASRCLGAGVGFCVPKAVTLAAVARAAGIPARIGFADVRNHLASPRLVFLMGNDVFRWHAYTLLWIDGAWVRATPAFDRGFCERFAVTPLDFDGRTDSLFQPFAPDGRRHMDYVHERGSYDDMPFQAFKDDMLATSPRLIAGMAAERALYERRIAAERGSESPA